MRTRLVSRIVPAGALLSLVSPALAHACAVCGGGTDRMRIAFLISTGFLSLLPLALIFGGVWWLRRQIGTSLRDEFLDRDDVAPGRARIEIAAPSATLPGTREPARI